MPGYNLPPCPFHVGSAIENPQCFVGRKQELQRIMRWMAGAQPISVNVVGPHRMGKSSLLLQVSQTYEQAVLNHGRQGHEFVGVYLSLQASQCRTVTSFYQTVAQKFLERPVVQANPTLRDPLAIALQASGLQDQQFELALNAWKGAGVLPVLCLDKFEELLENQREFHNDFYDSLRSLVDHSALMLVVASARDLKVYSDRHKLTSDFFNVFQLLPLEYFSEQEARQLAELPLQATNPVTFWTEDRITLMLHWGNCHPYLLQLAGSCLWDWRALDPTVKREARQRFEQGRNRVPVDWQNPKHWQRGIQKGLTPFIVVGKVTRGIGGSLGNVGDAVTGLVVVMILIALVLGWVNRETVLEIIKWVVGG